MDHVRLYRIWKIDVNIMLNQGGHMSSKSGKSLEKNYVLHICCLYLIMDLQLVIFITRIAMQCSMCSILFTRDTCMLHTIIFMWVFTFRLLDYSFSPLSLSLSLCHLKTQCVYLKWLIFI